MSNSTIEYRRRAGTGALCAAASASAILMMCLCGCHTVQLDSDPPGAKVIVDGEVWGTTPCTHTWVFGQKPNGFTAAMILPGYEEEDAPLLPRSALVSPEASLMTSAPGGARCFVNGTYIGDGPMYHVLFFPSSIKATWTPAMLAKAKPHGQVQPAQVVSSPQPTPQPTPAAARPVEGGPVRNRMALLVGLSEYKYRGKWGLANLRYAADDAKAMGEYLKSDSGGRFDEVILLTDEQATTTNVKAAVRERLRSAQKDDLVMIYWSGHGGPDPQDAKMLYLITYDTDPEHMASTGYAMDEFKGDVARLGSRRVLLLADTCHSAGISDPKIGLRGPADNRIVEGIKGVYVAPDKGSAAAGPMWMIFTSCEGGEFSRESAELGGGQGVFTYYLLQGLRGKADDPKAGGNGDGKVTLGEVIEYTRDQVKRFTGNQQHPDTAGQFDRALMMGAAK